MTPLDNGAVPRGTETILLVDPEPETRTLGAFMLRRQGYDVLEARSAAEAVSLFQRQGGAVHLLLTELRLPRASGSGLADELTLSNPEMSVLYLSAAVQAKAERNGRRAGILRKPFTMRTLAGKVRQILDAKPARAAGVRVATT